MSNEPRNDGTAPPPVLTLTPRCSDTSGAACCGADIHLTADALHLLRRALQGDWAGVTKAEYDRAQRIIAALREDHETCIEEEA